ncbi:MAG: peptidyl-prolyl cis-trans isomerase [Caulobacterales bacterium]
MAPRHYTPPMLALFRAFAKSWAAAILMGLLIVAFAVFGVRDVFKGRIDNAVIQAGDRAVTTQQWGKIFDRVKQDYETRTQQPYPLEEAVKEGEDKRRLDDLASETAYFEMLSRSGVQPSDDVVATELRKAAESGERPELAQVFDSVTGKFRPEALADLLRRNQVTLEDFQRELRDDIANQQFGSAIQSGFHTPRIYSAIQATMLLESRDVTYFVISFVGLPKPPAPTDAQLNALIQQFRERLMMPERRKVTIVRFSAKALAPTMPVDPGKVEQLFNVRKDKYGRPETRSVIEIPLNDAGTAALVQTRLARGDDPAAVAKSIGVNAIPYVDQPLTAIADRKAGVAAFAMAAPGVSGPVQGDFKTVILQVTKITPGQAPDLNAARPQLEADLRQQEAAEAADELGQKYDDARQSGASMADAAAKVGVTPITIGPITADGKDLATGQPDPQATQKVAAAAFSTAQGADSDVAQDTDKGEYFAVHVDQITPPSPPTLDEPGIRQGLTQIYYQQIVTGALKKKADAAIASIKAGGSFEAAAAAAGGHVTHQLGLQRITVQQYQQTLGDDFLGPAFGGKAGDVFEALSPPLKGEVVARVDAVRPGDPTQIARLIDAVRQHADPQYLQAIAATVRVAAGKMVKVRTDLTLARTTIGVDAAMVAKVTAKTPAKGAELAK